MRSPLLAGLAAGFVLSVAACGGRAEPPQAATTTVPPTSTPPSRALPTTDDPPRLVVDPSIKDPTDQRVADAYLQAERAFLKAAQAGQPNDALFGATHVGELYEKRRKVLQESTASGLTSAYPRPSVAVGFALAVRRSQESAEVDACWVDDSYTVRNGRAGGLSLSTYLQTGQLVLLDKRWVLAGSVEKGRWSGVAACALKES